MAIDQDDISTAKASVQKAVDAHSLAYQRLFAHDGKTTISGPDLHAKECARILAPLENAVTAATTLSDKALAQVEAQRLAPFADTTTQLNPIELEEAGRLASFVREDCQSLSLADLAERLRWTQSAGGKARHWLTMRYAVQRWKAEQVKTPQPADLAEFGAVLRDMGALSGPRAGLSPEAQKLADQAQSLSMFAKSQLRIAANPEQDKADKEAMRRSILSRF